MNLSGDIQDIINNALPLTIHCDSCERDIDLTELLSKREWDRLIMDILMAVTDKINE